MIQCISIALEIEYNIFHFYPSGYFVSHRLRSEDHAAEAGEECQAGKLNIFTFTSKVLDDDDKVQSGNE